VSRPARITSVTIGLIVGGAVFGAVAGGLALTIAVVSRNPELLGSVLFGAVPLGFLIGFLLPVTFCLGGIVGALFGAVCLPVFAWALLREVPLGRLVVYSMAGIVAGGVIGCLLAADFFVYKALAGSFTGLIAASIAMRRAVKSSGRNTAPRLA
jgi:hypothetical protein